MGELAYSVFPYYWIFLTPNIKLEDKVVFYDLGLIDINATAIQGKLMGGASLWKTLKQV